MVPDNLNGKKANTTDGWPRALERRALVMWLKYNDMCFFVYRSNTKSPIMISKFSRVGLQKDFWKLGTIINDKANLIIARDKSESNGPSVNKTGVVYIYIPPNIVIYHEMNEHGNTVTKKIYHADVNLRTVDFVAWKRNLYIISPDRMFHFMVREDQLRKEKLLSNFTENAYKQIGMTQGGVFLYVRRYREGERLYAHENFTDQLGHLHLQGKKVRLQNCGDQSYVVWVEGVGAKRSSYYYLSNTHVKRAVSMEFVEIKGIKKRYANAVQLEDRIHFYDNLDHAMYVKGSDKGIVRFPASNPIVGVWYHSIYQYLEEDMFLLVKDVDGKMKGRLSLTPVRLTEPRVVCVNEKDAVETYLKFVVYTRTKRYRFSVKITGNGNGLYVGTTYFKIAWCFAIIFFCLLISYCCMKKARADKEAGVIDMKLGNMEKLEGDDDENSVLDETLPDYGSDSSDEDEYGNALNISV